MEILGVPGRYFFISLLFTLIVTWAFFNPAISSFGQYLLGTEDMRLFIWIFSHFENSLNSCSNPFFAKEIFYPYGISLALTTISPIQSTLYWLLPESWGPFGKVTFLQVISFILGGVFSFCLVYRFTKSLFPSIIGMIVFNFSVYHFEKALHHLNYSMSFPFLALFFIFYFDLLERPGKRKTLALLSLSLLLLALTEITVAIMAGFIVFLDVFIRYLSSSGTRITPKNYLILFIGASFSLIANTVFAAFSFSSLFVYVLPSLFFLSACVIVLGFDNALRCEREFGHVQLLMLSSIPTLLYAGFLFFQPAYHYQSDSVIFNSQVYAAPLENLVFPSSLQLVSHFIPFKGLAEIGAEYIGSVAIVFVIFSFFSRKTTESENRLRYLFLLCLLFSFPILRFGNVSFGSVGFFAAPLFPGLAVLRVPSRFILFGLLFLSVIIGLVVKRMINLNTNGGKLLSLLVVLLLLLEYWPATDKFVFDQSVSEFYYRLASNSSDIKLFLYPNVNYYSLLNEIYSQTVHEKKLSVGVVARFPLDSNELYSLYGIGGNKSPDNAMTLARKLDYDYMVVQKLTCKQECFYGTFTPIDPLQMQNITVPLERELGPPVFEDDARIIYDLRKNESG